MIREIIKENMEYHNYSKRDLSELTGITVKTIENILNGKTEPNVETLNAFEKSFDMVIGDLVSIYIKSKHLSKHIDLDDKAQSELESIYKTYSFETIREKVKKLFKGKDTNEYREYLSSKLVSYYQYQSDNDLGSMWVAMAITESINRRSAESFRKTGNSTLIGDVFSVMSCDDDFETKISKLEKMLNKMGIVLINAPYIPGSSIRGASLKLNNNAYILLNDNGKRECYYTFTLLHEMMHLFKPNLTDFEINEIIAKNIKKSNKETKSMDELRTLVDAYGNEDQFEIVHKNTVRRISFGNYKSFIIEKMQ